MSRYDHLDLFMKMLEVLEKDIEASPRQVSPQERTKITNIIEKLEGNLIVRSVELEVDMSGDRINISDVRNSVINVKATLDHVEQAIGSLPIEPAARNDLRSLVQQLSTILERLPEGKGSEAEAISDAVKDAMDKVAKPQPNKKSIEISVKGILEAARDIAEALPVATKIAAAIGAMFGFTL
jgi:ElaB/YqjD/DUF883 family membrane-anchored ribosome-binding protein